MLTHHRQLPCNLTTKFAAEGWSRPLSLDVTVPVVLDLTRARPWHRELEAYASQASKKLDFNTAEEAAAVEEVLQCSPAAFRCSAVAALQPCLFVLP